MVNAKSTKVANNGPQNKSAGNKFKSKGNAGGVTKAPFKGGAYKKHGKPSFTKSKEAIKKERAEKFRQRQEAREQKQKELEEQRAKAKAEKEEKIKQYKKKRLERTKALSKRTQRGQPLMKDRMQLLLKQIQEMKKNG
ncbi:thyroid transcription factor 1-associated protein 26 [Musca vetustissima]|uniref:thyroid transcription factor 1-associated protein 26 n=1 Tax=Musca vetustissima TaxID=27455 RepID=UPI002AB7633C|nr:thyroid transcription factor 1-associated protein 26 [Musca vetustissima]